MDLQITRAELAKKLLEETRESVLEKIAHLLLSEEEFVASSVNGTPLTRSNYNSQLEVAKEEIRHGKVVSHNEVIKRVNSWE